MTAIERENKAKLHLDLIKLLTDCENDAEYFQRLTWALEVISNILSDYHELVYKGVQQRDLEENPPPIFNEDEDEDETDYNPYYIGWDV